MQLGANIGQSGAFAHPECQSRAIIFDLYFQLPAAAVLDDARGETDVSGTGFRLDAVLDGVLDQREQQERAGR